MENKSIQATTVVAIRHNGEVVIGSDGQATLGDRVVKSTVKKTRKLANGTVLTGFAGSPVDAFALLERFEKKLHQFPNNVHRAALELAKEWRTDRYLRRLEATIIVCNQETMLSMSGNGDVMKPDHDILAIGSGSPYAHAAAVTLKEYAGHLTAEEMVRQSLKTAADMCIYTNHHITIAKLAAHTK
ncbi:MAG: ATP-dependent protease subunit HslV [Cytophagales bacterium]